jgi:hypothetical protein
VWPSAWWAAETTVLPYCRVHDSQGAVEELERRYRAARAPHERSWWQILWLFAKGHTAAETTESTGYSRRANA